VRALLVGGDLERAASTGGVLLEDQRDVPTRKSSELGALRLGEFEFGRATAVTDGAGSVGVRSARRRTDPVSRGV
jgi:hypothetical protein